MVRKPVWLVAALILTHASVYGQSVKEVQTTTIDRPPGTTAAGKNSPDLAHGKEAILSSTNQFRRQQGRPALKVNQKLADAAQSFADYMARTDKYGHTADGKEPWERAADHGYAYCIVLENIAYDYNPEGFRTNDLVQGLMKGWKESSPNAAKRVGCHSSVVKGKPFCRQSRIPPSIEKTFV